MGDRVTRGSDGHLDAQAFAGVHAVDATSGKLIRKYHAGGNVFARPVVADGVLYVAMGNGWVVAFRLS